MASQPTDFNAHRGKKLNDQQIALIEIARRIRENNPMPPLEEISTLSGTYRDIAKALRRTRIDGGEEDFWKAYDTYAKKDYPFLTDWRLSIETTGEPG